jgi:hypothetical protein
MTQAFPSPSSEDEEENRNIIGKTPTCAAENCTGWLVDSFAGKYFIKCEDPKHNAANNDDNDSEEVEKEGKISRPSQSPDLNHKQLGTVTANTNTGDDSCR